jgi:positive regulator of sigma E activity
MDLTKQSPLLKIYIKSMIETGKVIKIEEEKAVVLLSSSEHCNRCKICLFDEKGQRILKIHNTVGAKIEDEVEVFIPDGMISKLSFSVFILPIVTFLIGYWIVWSMSGSEMLSAVGGATAFVLTFYSLWIYEKKLNQIKKDTLPYISKILKHENFEIKNQK